MTLSKLLLPELCVCVCVGVVYAYMAEYNIVFQEPLELERFGW